MRPQHVMFLGAVFTAGLLLSLVLGGAWLGTTDAAVANSMSLATDVSVFGLFDMPFPNAGFFLTGMKALISMDFAFLVGGYTLIQFVLIMVIVSAVVWGIFSALIYVAMGALKR